MISQINRNLSSGVQVAGKLFAMLAGFALFGAQALAQTVQAVKTEPPFDLSQSKLVPATYKYLEPGEVSRKWQLCYLLPHTDNPFMLSIVYGAVSQAQRMKVALEVISAGGYPNIAKQIDQIEGCVARGANAIIVLATSPTGVNNAIDAAAARKVVVIDSVNGVTSNRITGRVVTSYRRIGQTFGEYMAQKHPPGSGKVDVLYMAGPAGASYVEFMDKGFTEATANSDVKVARKLYAASSKAAQFPVVQDGLLSTPNVKYVAGNAPAIEAAYDILREKDIRNVNLVSGFVTPAVLELVAQGKVMAAVSASEVRQGSMAVDMALKALEGKLVDKDIAPNSFIIDANNIKTFDRASTVAPKDWKPVFRVD